MRTQILIHKIGIFPPADKYYNEVLKKKKENGETFVDENNRSTISESKLETSIAGWLKETYIGFLEGMDEKSIEWELEATARDIKGALRKKGYIWKVTGLANLAQVELDFYFR